jgi:hypothetical protein
MLALFFMAYNYCKSHKTLKKQTPAVAHGIADHKWTVRELLLAVSVPVGVNMTDDIERLEKVIHLQKSAIKSLENRVEFLESWLSNLGDAFFVGILWIAGPYCLLVINAPKWIILFWFPFAYGVYSWIAACIKGAWRVRRAARDISNT